MVNEIPRFCQWMTVVLALFIRFGARAKYSGLMEKELCSCGHFSANL